jgi:hypothetical protein
MTLRSLVLALLGLAIIAASGEAQQTKVKKDRNLITAQEISEAQATTAYDVIEKLRANWLRRSQRQSRTVYGRTGRVDDPTGGSDPSGGTGARVAVFVDGTEMGGVEELRRLQADRVSELRFLSSSDAQQQYGSRYGGGVIQVTLKTS